jgi:hypothetical protein
MIRRYVAVAAIAVGGAAGAAATAAADPIQPPKTIQIAATCTGLGDVLVTNLEPAQTRAFQVVAPNGTTKDGNTVILVGTTPGLLSRAQAAGTTCTVTAAGAPGALEPVEPPIVVPVVIING